MVTATEIVRTLVDQGEDIRVTVVPVFTSLTEHCDVENVIKFDRLSIVAYKGKVKWTRIPRLREKACQKDPGDAGCHQRLRTAT